MSVTHPTRGRLSNEWAASRRMVPKTGLRSHWHHQQYGPGAPGPLERHETRIQCVQTPWNPGFTASGGHLRDTGTVSTRYGRGTTSGSGGNSQRVGRAIREKTESGPPRYALPG